MQALRVLNQFNPRRSAHQEMQASETPLNGPVRRDDDAPRRAMSKQRSDWTTGTRRCFVLVEQCFDEHNSLTPKHHPRKQEIVADVFLHHLFLVASDELVSSLQEDTGSRVLGSIGSSIGQLGVQNHEEVVSASRIVGRQKQKRTANRCTSAKVVDCFYF